MTDEDMNSDVEAHVESLLASTKATYAIDSVAPHFVNKLDQQMANYKTTTLKLLRLEQGLKNFETTLAEGKYPKSFNIIKPVVSTKGEALQKKFNEAHQEALKLNVKALKEHIEAEIESCTKLLGSEGEIMKALTSDLKAITANLCKKASEQEKDQYENELRATVVVAINRLNGVTQAARTMFEKQAEKNADDTTKTAGPSKPSADTTVKKRNGPVSNAHRNFGAPYPTPYNRWNGPPQTYSEPNGYQTDPRFPRPLGRGRFMTRGRGFGRM
ncbi:hypothetical protein EXIGLDRAFT_784063 [Exidia glandulosa HHB12029]|uniref:Uncharacterized protein n=1 Tax=Exidia glandulosa HHB12029 TaxID=1314781 RepID=A0A166MQI7_EXIGL|nr:hypothetical protein EXIGLDRAFT_784063 [Exidia glandulosa HHB12029]